MKQRVKCWIVLSNGPVDVFAHFVLLLLIFPCATGNTKKTPSPTMPKATRDYHPSKHTAAKDRARTTRRKIEIPKNVEQIELKLSGRVVKLTNLKKLFWPELKITKRDLIQYYADVSTLLLPHLKDRARSEEHTSELQSRFGIS